MRIREKKTEFEIKEHSARIANTEQHVLLIHETVQRIEEELKKEIQHLKECNCKLDRNIEAKIEEISEVLKQRETIRESLKQRDQREGYEKDYHEGHEPQGGEEHYNEPDYEDNLSDVEADSQTLASAGFGTDEDYGGTDERL